jgi:hypothetical protein
MVIDEGLEESMKVTVIATGFDAHRAAARPVMVRPAMAAAGGGAAAAQPVETAGPRDEEHFPFRRHEAAAAATPSRYAEPSRPSESQRPAERLHSSEPLRPAPVPAAKAEADEPEHVPFYRKVIAHARGEDPHGYGPNWSNVDDYDIPTVLRKQMVYARPRSPLAALRRLDVVPATPAPPRLASDERERARWYAIGSQLPKPLR